MAAQEIVDEETLRQLIKEQENIMENTKKELSENALTHWKTMNGEYGMDNVMVYSQSSDEAEQNRFKAYLELEEHKILKEVRKYDDGIEYEILRPYRLKKD